MQYCTDLDHAERFIKRVYPDLADQTFDRTQQGNEYFTFLANDEVIRVARNEAVRNNMGREFSLLAQLNAKPFTASIPQAIDFQPENNIMRIQKISGKPLSEIMDSLSPEELKRIAEKTGLFLAELHGFFEEPSTTDQSEMVGSRDILLSRLEKLRSTTSCPEEQARLQRIGDYITGYESLTDRATMTHGDISPSNIIYDQSTEQIGIIDFNNCKSNLSHHDFSVMTHLFPASFIQDAMTSYADKTQLPLSDVNVRSGADTLSLIHGYKDEGMTFKPQLNF